jgi:hypothetical protein
MYINLDPDTLRTCMRLWRDSLSNAMPLAPEIHLHFIQERPTILRNYERTASAWLMAFRGAMPAPTDKDAFESMITDIETFQAWAKTELETMGALALQTAIDAELDELRASHPEVIARMAAYFRKKP